MQSFRRGSNSVRTQDAIGGSLKKGTTEQKLQIQPLRRNIYRANLVRSVFPVASKSLPIVRTNPFLDEPVVGHGPFVMNSSAEIQEAFEEYQLGKRGEIA
jgi:Pirin C-terminal cupin domain